MAAPLFLFWTVWQARNRAAFEDVAPSAHRMKITFLCTLWSRANLYSVDNIDSLVDFWCGWRIGEFEGFLLGPLFVYL